MLSLPIELALRHSKDGENDYDDDDDISADLRLFVSYSAARGIEGRRGRVGKKEKKKRKEWQEDSGARLARGNFKDECCNHEETERSGW